MEKINDLVGQRFGRLVVIERDGSNKSGNAVWKCQCDCGNIKSIVGTSLTRGLTQSCGCIRSEKSSERKKQNLLNQKFGKLTVIDYAPNRGRKVQWLCQCECGTIKPVDADHLRTGHTTSCGCINSKGEEKIANILRINHIPFKQQYYFKDLIGEKTYLRFDFAILDNNDNVIKLIEFQGIQHSNNNYYNFDNDFQKRLLYDQKKKDYCKENNIPLLIINYTKYNTIDLKMLLND